MSRFRQPERRLGQALDVFDVVFDVVAAADAVESRDEADGIIGFDHRVTPLLIRISSCRLIFVIPGPRVAENPGFITTVRANPPQAVIMDSGLAAARRSGMTHYAATLGRPASAMASSPSSYFWSTSFPSK